MLKVRRDSLLISSSNLMCRYLRYSATLWRQLCDSSLSRLVITRITLTTEQRIDIQGYSRSTTCVETESPYNDFLLVINCHLSSISHRFQDIASRSRKPPYPCLSPGWRIHPSNFAIKLITIKVKTYAIFM